ncbi:hypothetical protein C8J56DRAFT_853074 [Mycena floridula]|nr:hypothetical protein C8J56DRAFT_853074 [Mycena floridula]
MANPLIWPGKYYFYPIGNTSAVCLTRDIAPEQHTNILLLGCGDPRNVLYTIFNEVRTFSRKLDFTCCDIDPAVLARNIILFTMVIDKIDFTTIWKSFFHFKLDQKSYDILGSHCEKLARFSTNVEKWDRSSYGDVLKMSTKHTLSEVRRHWLLYIRFASIPSQRKYDIQSAFDKTASLTASDIVVGSVRSAGPTIFQGDALVVFPLQFGTYWKTGVTLTEEVASATLLNPTFVYSLGGEGCSVHYGTDPMAAFQHSQLFGNSKKEQVGVEELVKSARAQFFSWCSAYSDSTSSLSRQAPVVRFFVGEATAVCRAIQTCRSTMMLKTEIPTALFSASLLELRTDQPTTFTVVDTSNLDDHIGLLNVLVSTIPILSIDSPSVLYSESLLFWGRNGTKEFRGALFANISLTALLLGLCPVDYIAGFSSRSNTHELMMYKMFQSSQFHQVTVYKAPSSGDSLAANADIAPVFDSDQLGTLFWDIYQHLFEQEDPSGWLERNKSTPQKALSNSNIVFHIRETFVVFLKVIKDRLRMPEEKWNLVMKRFIDIQQASLPIAHHNHSIAPFHLCDLHGQMHHHGVHTLDLYRTSLPNIGRFSSWNTVPVLVRVILTVPRERLAVLGLPDACQVGTQNNMTLPLHCAVRGKEEHHIFNSVHTAFGRVTACGSSSKPGLIFEEDKEGWTGRAPLVISFTAPSYIFAKEEPQKDIWVHLRVRTLPATLKLAQRLGDGLTVFAANFLDQEMVQVLPHNVLPISRPQLRPQQQPMPLMQIGECSSVTVELDDECELVSLFRRQIHIKSDLVKGAFGIGRQNPSCLQFSPCVMRVSLAGQTQDVVFPFPIAGSQCKLRLARTSLYIEVVVPPLEPGKHFGMKTNPFPVIGNRGELAPWNIHRLVLDSLPALNCEAVDWLNTHVSMMLSDKERNRLRYEKDKPIQKHLSDPLMLVKDTLHCILTTSSGALGGRTRRLFAFLNKATTNCDTILFINDLAFDPGSHTIVCDAYVLCTSEGYVDSLGLRAPFTKLVNKSLSDLYHIGLWGGELMLWKHLLPAFAERCRTWKHGPNCEYNVRGSIPLSDKEDEIPLCSCGQGKDVEGMKKDKLWKPFAPYVTRVAISPLFAVSYLETVLRDPDARRCHLCRAKAKPRLQECSGCRKARYCSKECQKKDRKRHKDVCRTR